jgi:hypothetical protein
MNPEPPMITVVPPPVEPVVGVNEESAGAVAVYLKWTVLVLVRPLTVTETVTVPVA